MSALYDGKVTGKHIFDGRVYELTVTYRANGKDYEAHRTWYHSHERDFNTAPPMHNRDSMKWACAKQIDDEAAADLAKGKGA